jgi:hypothetical protein
MSPAQAAALRDKYVNKSHVKETVRSTCKGMLDPLAFIYLKGVVPKDIRSKALRGLEQMKFYNSKSSLRAAVKKSQGGYLEFGWRAAFGKIAPYAPNKEQKAQYALVTPLVDFMDGVLAKCLPEYFRGQNLTKRRKAQMHRATKTSTFSSVTMLKSAPTSVHLDSNNSETGFTVLTTVGKYTGGSFVLPQYGLEIPIKPGDVLIARTHREWHGNFKKVKGTRFSIIGYRRESLRK